MRAGDGGGDGGMIVTLPIPAPCRASRRAAFRRVAGGTLVEKEAA